MTSTEPHLKLVVLNGTSSKTYNKFNRVEFKTNFRIKHNISLEPNLFNIEKEFETEIRNLLKEILLKAEDDDYMTISLIHNDMETPIFIAPQKVRNYDYTKIFKRIQKIAQSFKMYLASGEFELVVGITKTPMGSGRIPKAPKTIDEISKNKKSIVSIKNYDNTCGIRALFISKYHFDNRYNLNRNEWRQIIGKNDLKLKIYAKRLAEMIGIKFNTKVGPEEWKFIQSKLINYQIFVIDALNKYNFIFKGPNNVQKIYIEYYNNHYNSIVNIKGYYEKRYFCDECYFPYNNFPDHKCPIKCNMCYSICPKNGDIIICNDCNRIFKNKECFKFHKQNKLCIFLKRCLKCDLDYRAYKKHNCGKFICRKCGSQSSHQPHYCYINPKNLDDLYKEDNINKIIVSYDIESTQENLEHVPNLLICKVKCDQCEETHCNICHGNTNIYFGKSCIIKFVDYLFNDLAKIAEKNKSLIFAFAHNARGYDAQFVLRELWNRYYDNVEIILRGRKILLIKCGNVKMLDSLNFFLQPLDKLPKALGLDINVKKGNFPHLFNKSDNYNYVGCIPALKYFGIEYMNIDNKHKLEEWYDKQLGKSNWCFKTELINYCKNDVDILLECVMKFRKSFKEITGLDPITRSFTLASIAMETFTSLYLNKFELANTPVMGYKKSKNFSFKSNCWLDLLENKNLIREYRIGRYWVDAYDVQSKIIYEFLGCYWHGCKCQTIDRDAKLITSRGENYSLNERYSETCDKLNFLKKQFRVEEIWECEFDKKLSQNIELKNKYNTRFRYYKTLKTIGSINIKDAFFGGRTNNIQYHKKVLDNEEIKYLDFCSLYPYVIKYNPYPIDHPIVINENFNYSIDKYFGIIKCKVTPPKNLYLPVLPVIINKKLLFPLCINCAKNKCKNCKCDDRSFIGTWVSEELKLAIEKGYVINEIYEILDFKRDICTNKFMKYIDMWLKIKQQASGWPEWCKSENDKLRYIAEYKQKEDIDLDYNKISKNEALRFIAKIMLNSFWGKFAQKPNQNQTEIIKSINQYFDIVLDTGKSIKGEYMVNDDTMILTWQYKNDDMARARKYNLTVASFVTAYARIKLYRLMDKIEEIRPYSLLYHDTDSVLYYRKYSDPLIECGDYLGDLTDEIIKNYGSNAKCIEFASLGPKNYGYSIQCNDEVKSEMKCKGIALNYLARQSIDFKKIIELALNNDIDPVLVKQRQFDLNRHNQIKTRYFDKQFRLTSDKRFIKGNLTFPYGYINP